LSADPGESRDLYGEHPDQSANLKEKLDAWEAGLPSQQSPSDEILPLAPPCFSHRPVKRPTVGAAPAREIIFRDIAKNKFPSTYDKVG